MKAPRYSSSRQKSCHQCSDAKAKCDRKQGRCTRCAHRCLACIYPGSNTLGERQSGSVVDEALNHTANDSTHVSASEVDGSNPSSLPDLSTSANGSNLAFSDPIMDSSSFNQRDSFVSSVSSFRRPRSPIPNPTSSNMREVPEKPEILDFSCLDLICPVKVDDINNRWLKPYIPDDGQEIKEYPPSVTRFIDRVLKSYAGVAARGRHTLPFIHSSQMKTPDPRLATCLNLVRISANPIPGSEDTSALVIQREMESIVQANVEYDDMSLLAAFQAYLIYTMVLYFQLSQRNNPFFRSAMISLQQLACFASRRGLMCTADANHTRPRWEEWIVTEAKRRTLYVMYLFDSVLSANENLPTFLGTELRSLPAPSNKSLWQASNRRDWDNEYNIFLADWMEGGLTIDELWPIPPDLDNMGVLRRRMRVDQWLENLDEFGTMTFAVTSCTHPG